VSRSFRGLASRRRCLLIRGHRGGSKETIFPRELSVWAATSVGIGFCNFAFPLKIVSPEAMATRESWGAARKRWTRAAPRQSSRAARHLGRGTRGSTQDARLQRPLQKRAERRRRAAPSDPFRNAPRDPKTRLPATPSETRRETRKRGSQRPLQKRAERRRRATPSDPFRNAPRDADARL
jgi:hypothetical protein